MSKNLANNLINSINNFGIIIINNLDFDTYTNLPNIITHGPNKYYLNIKTNSITFFYLSKFFSEKIIIDIANRLGIKLIDSNSDIISSNWLVQLESKKIISYLINLYEIELTKTNIENAIEKQNKSKNKGINKGINKKKNTTTNKKKSIPLALKRKVWDFWIGESVGKIKCPCCKLTDISQMSFSCGHIIPESKGGQLSVQNLKPICGSCNSSMGTQNMDDFIRNFGL
jgi:hypothetical protein